MIVGQEDKPPLAELVHFGVKGMKWGVRHDPAPSGNRASRRAAAKNSSGRGSSGTALSDRDKAVLKAAGVSESAGAHLQSKYGPGTLGPEPKPHRLTPEQKKVIAGVVVAAGVAGAAYYLHKQGAFGGFGGKLSEEDFGLKPDAMSAFKAERAVAAAKPKEKTWQDIPSFMKEFKQYQVSAATRQNGYTADMVKNLDTKPIHIPAGTIFKRVSTEKESEINPFGFFASHDDADVDRYKAILPVFWKQWGLGAKSGYVVNLKAAADIKAPSHRETFDIFKGMLHEELDGKEFGMPGTVKVKDLFFVAGGDDEELARKAFPQAAQLWNTNAHPLTKKFVAKVKEKGYNALPDMNDAGSLSKSPMRLLDGSMFSVVGHDELSADAIRTAQESIQALVHAMLFELGYEYLAHFGVKGMKWGVRRQTPERQLAKLHRKLDKIDGNKVYDGYGLRGHQAQKMAKKHVNDPNYTRKKMTEAQLAAVDRTASRKARRALVARGAIDTAIILGGSQLLIRNMGLSATNQRGATVAVALLAAQQIGGTRISEFRSVNQADKMDRIRKEIKTLDPTFGT